MREADGLIVGAPNYFGDLCAEFKLFYERLLFQYLTYRKECISYNERPVPVLLISTSNAPVGMYSDLMESYRTRFETFIGPTTVLEVGATMQVKDYGKYDWTMFDGPSKVERRERIFPQELKKAYELGASVFRRWIAFRERNHAVCLNGVPLG